MDHKEILNNPENVKLLINLLQSLLPNNEKATIESSESDSPKPPVSKIKTKSRSRKKVLDDETINKFSNMPEFSMHKEDSEIDKKLSKHPPVSRMRDFEPVEATCRICGKTEVVAPGLIFEGASRYKCNNCSTQAG